MSWHKQSLALSAAASLFLAPLSTCEEKAQPAPTISEQDPAEVCPNPTEALFPRIRNMMELRSERSVEAEYLAIHAYLGKCISVFPSQYEDETLRKREIWSSFLESTPLWGTDLISLDHWLIDGYISASDNAVNNLETLLIDPNLDPQEQQKKAQELFQGVVDNFRKANETLTKLELELGRPFDVDKRYPNLSNFPELAPLRLEAQGSVIQYWVRTMWRNAEWMNGYDAKAPRYFSEYLRYQTYLRETTSKARSLTEETEQNWSDFLGALGLSKDQLNLYLNAPRSCEYPQSRLFLQGG